MVETILEKIRKIFDIVPVQPVVVGFSGGPDSLCLLDVLLRMGVPVVAVHINHQLRPEARDDARQAAHLAKRLGATFVLVDVDVRTHAQEERQSLEEAGRLVRYKALFAEAEKVKAQAVATGHHADDQVETVLMHLLRGAGLPGLKGMLPVWRPNPWSQKIPLVRPLLHVWRDEVLAYCADRALQPVYDDSNLDLVFYRNRIRHELLPMLETYNPKVKDLLHRMSGLLADEDNLLEQQTRQYWEAVVLESHTDALAFEMEKLLVAPLAIQRRLWRFAIQSLRNNLRDIDLAMVASCLDFTLKPPRSGQMELAAGLILRLEGEKLWLAENADRLPVGDWPQLPGVSEFHLSIPGCLALRENWEVCAEWVSMPDERLQAIRENPDKFVAFVQLPAGSEHVVLRIRRPGESFPPFGMGGRSTKLSDLMINQKIPARVRGSWPLVCVGESVIWVPGCSIREGAQVTDPPGRVARLWIRQKSG